MHAITIYAGTIYICGCFPNWNNSFLVVLRKGLFSGNNTQIDILCSTFRQYIYTTIYYSHTNSDIETQKQNQLTSPHFSYNIHCKSFTFSENTTRMVLNLNGPAKSDEFHPVSQFNALHHGSSKECRRCDASKEVFSLRGSEAASIDADNELKNGCKSSICNTSPGSEGARAV